jgi:hypothetical protein
MKKISACGFLSFMKMRISCFWPTSGLNNHWPIKLGIFALLSLNDFKWKLFAIVQKNLQLRKENLLAAEWLNHHTNLQTGSNLKISNPKPVQWLNTQLCGIAGNRLFCGAIREKVTSLFKVFCSFHLAWTEGRRKRPKLNHFPVLNDALFSNGKWLCINRSEKILLDLQPQFQN